MSGQFFYFLNVPVLIFILFCLVFKNAESAERVVGANSSLEIPSLLLQNNLSMLAQNPLQLAEHKRLSLAFMHIAYFEETSYNGVAMALPLKEAGTLGFAVSRFGASDIPYIKEGEPLPEGENYNTLNISDWIFTSAWGRNFGKWNAAVSLHLLKRELDQTGWGFSSDVAAAYIFSKKFMLAGILKSWTSSAVTWESGYFEYTNPELHAAFKYREHFPYFYGNLNVYWQSAGILHSESEEETRVWQNPLNWFLASGAGLEFETNFLFSLRAGLVSIDDLNSLSLGAGIKPVGWLSANYEFQMHGELSNVHKISLTLDY